MGGPLALVSGRFARPAGKENRMNRLGLSIPALGMWLAVAASARAAEVEHPEAKAAAKLGAAELDNARRGS